MDTRRRISFNMNTGGGQPTEPSTGGTYTVNLNGQWEATTAVPNPDSTLYDGVYRSSSNYNVDNGVAIMYITIKDCSSFKMYIRSYAESNFDYVMVSQLDKTITGSSSYSDTTLVKAHTRGNQQSGTALSSYTLVEFTGITSGEHTITVVYRKDSSINSGDDRGYVLIQKSNGSSGSTPDNPGTSVINTDNYLTILALEDGLTAKFYSNACQYCIDGDGNWIDLPERTTTQSINQGQTLSFKANLTPNSSNGIGAFVISKKCNLEGNCMSLLFGDDAMNNYSLAGKDYAFSNLFSNCTTIIQVSDTFLPATTLASSCYYYMFEMCYGLTTAPELPATTLADKCYYGMFYDCNRLTTAPELPATTLANNCYKGMFHKCISLTTAPELPATTLDYYCYESMFKDCTSLTTAPDLPATTLTPNCYHSMFQNCRKLNYIKMLATDISASNCLTIWVSNVASTGTFVKNPSMTSLPTGSYGIPSGWTVVDDDSDNTSDPTNTPSYMTILALEDGLQAKLNGNTISYSLDEGNTWTSLASDTYTPTVNSGQTIMFKGNLTPASFTGIGTFTINKKCNLEGNCMSLLFGDDVVNNSLSGKSYAFYKLFYDCTTIIQVSKTFLPATTLTSSCYSYMFYGCTNLTTAPELPATTLAGNCYSSMFEGCTSLVTGPSMLPATKLYTQCCATMFNGCTSLTTAPELPATTLADYCYTRMFDGCTSLTTAPELPAVKLNRDCYFSMFQGCTSLTTAPELPATTLVYQCYYSMFKGCTSLVNAPELPATTLSESCYYHMFYGTNVLPDCSNLNFSSSAIIDSKGLRGLFAGTKVTDADLFNILPINPSTGKYWLPSTTLGNSCYQYMFDGCTSLTTAPELPATTLADGCYGNMFRGCTSLVNAPELPATMLNAFCYTRMFNNCTSLTTAPELPATTLVERCYENMFEGCTSLVNAPELPATTLASSCYNSMFYECNKLNYIKMLAIDISADRCLSNWVLGVSSTGTFVKNPSMTSLPTGVSGIPSGWTVVGDSGENGGEDGGEDVVLTFPLYLDLNNATQIDEGYYQFEPSALSQSLLDWAQEIGLNFDAEGHYGGSGGGSDDGTISLTSKNANYKIIIGDYELTYVTTERGMFDICFYNNGWTCELYVAKDNSYVEFYIY